MILAGVLLAIIVLLGVGLFVLDQVRRYDPGTVRDDYRGRHRDNE